jgi:hypothetical protein
MPHPANHAPRNVAKQMRSDVSTHGKSIGRPWRLTEEASVVVVLNDIQEILDRCDFRTRLITMPFQVGTLPENLPTEFALIVGRLGNGMFEDSAFVHPIRTELKYLDALSAYAERKINLGTKMWRRSPLLDEFGDELLAAL